MLQLSQVSKSYGDTVVLAPTDLQVSVGKTIVLIGPSGCGKSTLLRLIIGLVKSDTGTITFNDTEITSENISPNTSENRLRDTGRWSFSTSYNT